MSARSNRRRPRPELLDKQPPSDLTTERATLGSILLKPDCFREVSAIVAAADFHDPLHQRMFATTAALSREGKPIDLNLLLPRLKGQEAADGSCTVSAAYIAELVREHGTATNATHYAQRVADLAKRRRLLALAEETIVAAHGDKGTDTLLVDTAERLQAIGAGPRAADFQPVLVRLSDVQPRNVEWLWPGRIALGKLTLLVGDPGLGKSCISLDLATRVSLGSPWPDNRTTCAPLGSAVLLNAEDTLDDVVRPRLDALGADVGRIVALQAVKSADAGNPLPFSLQRDVPVLEQVIKSAGDCRLVVVDPVSAYLGQTDSHKNADVRALLAPLCDLADRMKVAIVAVTHLNKGNGGSALYRATGSLAFVAAARAAWIVAKDPDEPRRRLFLPIKNNLAGDTLGMAYSFRDGVVAWEPEPVAIDADKALAALPHVEQTDDAADWLRQALADGPVAAKELFADAHANGFTQKQLRAAKKRICAESRKDGFGSAGGWEWYLFDGQCAKDSQRCPSEALGIYGHQRESMDGDGQPTGDDNEVVEWSA